MKLGNEIEVESVVLHQSVVINGVQTDKTISRDKYRGIEMKLIPQGLYVFYKDAEYIIPVPAIGSCKLMKRELK